MACYFISFNSFIFPRSLEMLWAEFFKISYILDKLMTFARDDARTDKEAPTLSVIFLRSFTAEIVGNFSVWNKNHHVQFVSEIVGKIPSSKWTRRSWKILGKSLLYESYFIKWLLFLHYLYYHFLPFGYFALQTSSGVYRSA